MKLLITLAIIGVGALSTPAKPETNVTAYRLTDFNDPNNPNDDQHAYFDKLACADYFQTLHPDYVRNGKVSVPSDWVFTGCIL